MIIQKKIGFIRLEEMVELVHHAHLRWNITKNESNSIHNYDNVRRSLNLHWSPHLELRSHVVVSSGGSS